MASSTLDSGVPKPSSTLWLWGMLALSFGAHALGILLLEAKPIGGETNKPVELVMFEVEPPRPPPLPEPPKPVPAPVKPPPIKVASSEKPPPPSDAPPPPNDAPPPETPSKPVPLVVGISMSSTTSAGSFAAPVGNTVYGKTEKQAQDPSQVKAYQAPNYRPVAQVDLPPECPTDIERPPYPDEARRAGIEGQVLLNVVVDDAGQVLDVKVIRGIGYGLDETARTALKRIRCKPAKKDGTAVATTIPWTFTFTLD